MGCTLLLQTPGRGKEVTRQLLCSGQIPGVFLKEMGCRETWTGLCTAPQRCPAGLHLQCWAGDGLGTGTRGPSVVPGCCPLLLPPHAQPFRGIKGLFSQLTPLNPEE